MDKFIGQITLFGCNFAPQGWAVCQGQTLPIGQNAALFSLLGNKFGGNGTSNFQLPDLRGRLPNGMGQGTGMSANYALGGAGGVEIGQPEPCSNPAAHSCLPSLCGRGHHDGSDQCIAGGGAGQRRSPDHYGDGPVQYRCSQRGTVRPASRADGGWQRHAAYQHSAGARSELVHRADRHVSAALIGSLAQGYRQDVRSLH